MRSSRAGHESEVEASHFVVEAENLVKRYGAFTAVDGVSLFIKKGKCTALLGPNGAGKTTIIKIISCLYPRTEGKVKVFGLDPDLAAREIKRRLGVVPQENSLDLDLSVIQNLVLYASYFNIPRAEALQRAEQLMEEFGLKEFKNWKISDLSGGLRRRLTIARAFIHTPEMLILDEPTTGLDPQARQFIWDKLEKFKKLGTTMLLTTHYIEEAQRFADEVLIIDRGKILTAGEPQELIYKFARKHVVEILRTSASNSDNLLSRLDEMGAEVEKTSEKFFIYTYNLEPIIREIKKLNLSEFRVRESTLEDVFIRLTGRELRK